jgi:hypothetical protein
MNQMRTGGMIAIGVLNIIFGAFGCLGAMLMVLVGGGLAAIGTAAVENAAEGQQVAAAGGAVALLGLFEFTIGIMLFIGGIGVLKVAPWGRGFSLAAAALAIVNGLGQAVILSAFGIGTILGLIYPVVLIICFNRQDWKAAFSGQCDPAAGVIGDADNDQFQAAA